MELYEVRALQALSEEGSLRGAATRMNMSASAVSRYVRQLEADIGTDLVQRNQRSFGLTVAGEVLLAETNQAATAFEHAAEAARRHISNRTRRMRIAHNGASALDLPVHGLR